MKKFKSVLLLLTIFPSLAGCSISAKDDDKITVTFNAGDGFFNQSQKIFTKEIDKGTKIVVPPTPSLKGYTHDNEWVINGKTIDLDEYVFYENTTLTASYDIINYNIFYDVSGGINNQSNPSTYTVNDSFDLLKATKLGYTFSKWTLNSQPITKISKGTTGDMILLAEWNVKSSYVALSSNNNEYGLVTGAGVYNYNSLVTIKATPKEKCKFVGWYQNDKLMSINQQYSFSMPDNNVELVAKFEKTISTITVYTETPECGSTIGNGNYDVGEKVTITAIPYTGYVFAGWKDSTNYGYCSTNSSYTFTKSENDEVYCAVFQDEVHKINVVIEPYSTGMVIKYPKIIGPISAKAGELVQFEIADTKDYYVTSASWYLKDYSNQIYLSDEKTCSFIMPNYDIQLDCHYLGSTTYPKNPYYYITCSVNDSLGTITKNKDTAYPGDTINLKATSVKGSTFIGWYDFDGLVSEQANYSFVMPNKSVILNAKFKQIEFGRYPISSVVNDAVYVNLCNKAGKTPTLNNDYAWIKYERIYEGIPYLKNTWIYDMDVDNDGIYDYRGVYFLGYSLSGDYGINTPHWFKYEPIKWRQFNNLMLVDQALDCHPFNYGKNRIKTNYLGETKEVDQNIYEYSNIRTFLNVEFYNTAFNNEEKDRILATTYTIHSFSSKNTSSYYVYTINNEKISLFERNIWKTYSNSMGNNKMEKVDICCHGITDYARCMGLSGSGLYTSSPVDNSFGDNNWINTVNNILVPDSSWSIKCDNDKYGFLPVFTIN